MSTSEERAEWARLADPATEGPWGWADGLGGRKRLLGADGSREVLRCSPLLEPDGPDACLIAAARTAVPALLADVERLTREVEGLPIVRDQAQAEADALAAQVKAVRAIHHPWWEAGIEVCVKCCNHSEDDGMTYHERYPCPTIRALDEEAER